MNYFRKYLCITLGCIMQAVAVNLFFVPHHLLSSGVGGIAIIFYYLFALPIGLQIILMNIPLLYAAFRFIGKSYVVTTIYGTVLFSVGIDMTKFMILLQPIDDPLLSGIAGGVLCGIGAGLIFRVDGNAGGLDIICAIVKKYYSYNVGFVGLVVNTAIVLVSATLFGLKLAVLTVIAIFIGAVITDKVVEGINGKKNVFIISYRPKPIIDSILKETGRGVTILHGQGAYTGQYKTVVFVVVNLSQIAHIKTLVHAADPEAFMIVHNATEVLGKGFTIPATKNTASEVRLF